MPLKLSPTLVLLAAVALLAAPAASEATTPAQRASENRTFGELQRAVRQRVDSHNSPGIVAGMLFPDGRTRVFAYGRRAPGKRLDRDAVFEIGSITKVFTGTLLAEMAQRGEVALDEPVASLLPPGLPVPAQGERQITLADLATHTSGLPRDPTNLDPKDRDPFGDYSVKQLDAFLADVKLTGKIGSDFVYSNVGAALLGHALSLRAGRSYEQLVRERILDRLGMNETELAPTASMRRRLVRGHDVFGAPALPFGETGTLAPAGSLRSTVSDMLRFAAANLALPGDGVLGRAMAIARTPRFEIAPGAGIGLHWILDGSLGREIVWHDGGTYGQSTLLGLDPSRGTAIMVLSASKVPVGDIALHALDDRSPLERVPKAIVVPRETLERYPGTYSFRGDDELGIPALRVRFTLTGGRLVARASGLSPLRLRPESRTKFFFNMGVRVRFKLGGGRKAKGAVLTLEGIDLVGRRVGR